MPFASTRLGKLLIGLLAAALIGVVSLGALLHFDAERSNPTLGAPVGGSENTASGVPPPSSVTRPNPDLPSATNPSIPAFPWPPPRPSADYHVGNRWVVDGPNSRLSDVAARIEAALQIAEFSSWRYWSVPHGFALVTQFEQIASDGTPKRGKDRFLTTPPSPAAMTFLEFVAALAIAPPGRYRIIVFVVTDVPFSQAQAPAAETEARRWLARGLFQLPAAIGELRYDDRYRTTALVYEYVRNPGDVDLKPLAESGATGRTHLEKAHIWSAMTAR